MRIPLITFGLLAFLLTFLSLCQNNTVPTQDMVDRCNSLAMGAPGVFDDCIRDEMTR